MVPDPNFSIWRELIKGGIGLVGKVLMGAADNFTGGLASKLLETTIGGLTKHSGLIGKVAKGLGENFLSDNARCKKANIAESALKYVPEGNVKTALSSINKSVKGETVVEPKVSQADTSKPIADTGGGSTNHHARTYF
ncbi:hypothetical protein M9Y10_015394 [Tritrichomonas musculus]|uniref:Uncharacterized protein n=1 Tax=Tritrichomonas musculus TaxID=1915356 RepID=A0ABR2L260_9EUKA